MQQDGLRHTLRKRGVERLDDMELSDIEEGDERYDKSVNINNVVSFVQEVPLTKRSLVGKSFGGWKLQTLMARRSKLEGMRMEKMYRTKLRMRTFEGWKSITHFISRRITFDRSGGGKSGGGGGISFEDGIFGYAGGHKRLMEDKVERLQEWSEAKMSNFLNKKYSDLSRDSFISEGAFRFNAASAAKHDINSKRIDDAIGLLTEQYHVKR